MPEQNIYENAVEKVFEGLATLLAEGIELIQNDEDAILSTKPLKTTQENGATLGPCGVTWPA